MACLENRWIRPFFGISFVGTIVEIPVPRLTAGSWLRQPPASSQRLSATGDIVSLEADVSALKDRLTQRRKFMAGYSRLAIFTRRRRGWRSHRGWYAADPKAKIAGSVAKARPAGSSMASQ